MKIINNIGNIIPFVLGSYIIFKIRQILKSESNIACTEKRKADMSANKRKRTQLNANVCAQKRFVRSVDRTVVRQKVFDG